MTTIDRTGASDAEFEAHIAPLDAAPVPDEVVVETVARVLHKGDPTAWACGWPCSRSNHYRRLAAAAIAALPPSPAEEALREFAEWVLSISYDPPARRTITLEQIVQRAALACDPDLRAALASPAPAPQGEEGQR